MDKEVILEEREMAVVDIDLDDSTLESLTKLSEETNFTIDRIVEYVMANQIISEAIKKIQSSVV
jgi:hypothetical protein